MARRGWSRLVENDNSMEHLDKEKCFRRNMSAAELEAARILIDRPALEQDLFEDCYGAKEPEEPLGFVQRSKKQVLETCSCSSSAITEALCNIFPILSWLPSYNWREQFVYDVFSGCTVAVMHIPQGMGYALLGGVAPIIGIYMAFFPVLIYAVLGTSHHISMGTFAVVTLMTGRVVDQYSTPDNLTAASALIPNTTMEDAVHLSHLEVATAVCLMVGLWQVLMSVLRLGILGLVLSDHLVSGFTTGAAVHVLTSQIKNLLGIPVPRFTGAFRLIYSYVWIFSSLPHAKVAEVITSSVAITALALHNDYLKPLYGKHLKFPVPVELLVLVLGTLVSYFGQLNETFGIRIIEHIPTGLPEPKSPPFWLLPKILFDTIAIAVVAYAVSLSMAKIFASKRGYKVRANQELLAQGASNVVGSFFSCMPSAASLSRSLLQESVGGQTQLASVVSCGLLLIVLLWIGPFFESLPLSILASVIVVALKGMFMQVKDFVLAYKCSPLDAVVWAVSFLAVVFIDIDIGLGIGVISSIAVLFYRGQQPYAAVLGNLPGTEFFVDVEQYPTAVQEPGIKVVRWSGGLHFANCSIFRKFVDQSLRVPPILGLGGDKSSALLESGDRGTLEVNSQLIPAEIRCLVIDCSSLAFVDLSASTVLSGLSKSLSQDGVVLCLAGCSPPVLGQLEQTGFTENVPKEQFYPSVIDAIVSRKPLLVVNQD